MWPRFLKADCICAFRKLTPSLHSQIQIASDCQERYITQQDDTCLSISAKFLNANEVGGLINMNRGLNCQNLRANQVCKILVKANIPNDMANVTRARSSVSLVAVKV